MKIHLKDKLGVGGLFFSSVKVQKESAINQQYFIKPQPKLSWKVLDIS